MGKFIHYMERKKTDAFSRVHPLVNFGYYCLVLGISMFCLQPIILLLSFLGGFMYSILLKGWKKAVYFQLKICLPSILMVVIVNLVFNHYGTTVLFYVKNIAITLESLSYGLVLALVLASLLNWFASYNIVMTTDKFVYLFGRIAPSTALVLSMVFRFFPKFSHQLGNVENGQKSLGRSITTGKLSQRFNKAVTITSIMTTWFLEDTLETADAMKARGYGLKPRTTYTIYRFNKQDCFLAIYLLIFSGAFFWSLSQGGLVVSYEMGFTFHKLFTRGSLIRYSAFFLLSNLPLGLAIYENLCWKYYLSRISAG